MHCQVSEIRACCKRRHLCNLRCILTRWYPFNLQPQKAKVIPTSVNFSITPDTMQNVREVRNANDNLLLGSLNAFVTAETWLCVSREARCPNFLWEAIWMLQTAWSPSHWRESWRWKTQKCPSRALNCSWCAWRLAVSKWCEKMRRAGLQRFTLLRLSRPGCAEGYARDATEIQNIQIAEGDVCRSLPIPIYMVFPRLFTCPTLETTNFKVGEWIWFCSCTRRITGTRCVRLDLVN